MSRSTTRRTALKSLAGLAGGGLALGRLAPAAVAAAKNKKWESNIKKGLDWLADTQTNRGHWAVANYPAAMAALAGTALTASGSTTTQGPYAKNIRRAVDYLVEIAMRRIDGKLVPRHKGLIGDPFRDNRYTYGHGFSMLFLSQVLGEEEDEQRRKELTEVLTHAVKFSALAQTKSGGWGYVSAKDGSNFDEGSTTITQVQGLRGCRNAGLPVPTEVIENAREYIYKCKNSDGGISYSSRNRGTSRPAITAAALATLYNAGAWEDEGKVSASGAKTVADKRQLKRNQDLKDMLAFCKKRLYQVSSSGHAFGHWHYTYLYYSQVVYRQGKKDWEPFRDKLYNIITSTQKPDGSWSGNIGPVYVTSCNLIMLQLDKGFLPIYQR